MQAKQNEKYIHYSPFSGNQYSAISKRAELHQAWWWFWKTNSITVRIPLFLLLSPGFYLDRDVTQYGIAMASCPGCVVFKLIVHPQPPHWYCDLREQGRPWCCVSSAKQQWNIPVLATVSSTNLKHSPILAVTRKLTLSQPKSAQWVLSASANEWDLGRVFSKSCRSIWEWWMTFSSKDFLTNDIPKHSLTKYL